MPVDRGPRIGVDAGAVRVGVAASDPDGLLATPVETVQRAAGDADVTPDAPDVRRLAEIVADHDAAVVYVGLPRHLSGAEGAAAGWIRTYAGALATAVAPVPVRLVDERMSTVTAHRSLRASGRAGRKQRAVVDQAAAVVILQTALDTERAAGVRAGELVPSGLSLHDRHGDGLVDDAPPPGVRQEGP